jgi:hypothetical protein
MAAKPTKVPAGQAAEGSGAGTLAVRKSNGPRGPKSSSSRGGKAGAGGNGLEITPEVGALLQRLVDDAHRMVASARGATAAADDLLKELRSARAEVRPARPLPGASGGGRR